LFGAGLLLLGFSTGFTPKEPQNQWFFWGITLVSEPWAVFYLASLYF